MRLSRTDLAPVLAIVTGGVIGASLSFSFLGSPAVDVQPVAADVPAGMVISPVVAPSPSAEFLPFDMLVLPPNNVAARAADLVREQHYIEESMKRLGEQGLGRSAAGSETGRLLYERKEAMHDEIVDLEQEILRLSREAHGETLDLLNDAATTIDEDKLKERVRYSRALIGGEDREYTREFEAETSRIVEELLEELDSASRGPAPIRGLLFERR